MRLVAAYYVLPGRLGKNEKEDADEEERSKLTGLIPHDPETGKVTARDGHWRENKALPGHPRLEAGEELELMQDLDSVRTLDAVGKKPQENVRFRGGVQLRDVIQAVAGVDLRPHGPTIWHKEEGADGSLSLRCVKSGSDAWLDNEDLVPRHSGSKRQRGSQAEADGEQRSRRTRQRLTEEDWEDDGGEEEDWEDDGGEEEDWEDGDEEEEEEEEEEDLSPLADFQEEEEDDLDEEEEGQSTLVELHMNGRTAPSERVRSLMANFKLLIPHAEDRRPQAQKGPGSLAVNIEWLDSLLAPELGRYDEQQAKEHPPLDWLIDHVLAEGAEQAAAIRACIVVRDHHTFLDLAALHKKAASRTLTRCR